LTFEIHQLIAALDVEFDAGESDVLGHVLAGQDFLNSPCNRFTTGGGVPAGRALP
jgi:hypothetical protein